ncbi:hypothetical protein WJN01_02535 [Flavobacteriaceae bacterium SZ-1-7]|uniref:hypothetical protein n=1 Tax=Tamlana sedimenti TaxID=3134126 RepID=UPI0031210103
MEQKKVGRYLILGILFFLPVTFLLMLYPATHNYTPLDIVGEQVLDIDDFASSSGEKTGLKDNITVLGFFGANPLDNATAASNLKELVYDKFKGFKKFQIVILMPNGTEDVVEKLKAEISSYEDLKFWHFVFGEFEDLKKQFNSLKSVKPLSSELSSNNVFIIDKDLNQRGRLDDRTDREIEKNKPMYGLYAYNCIEVAEIKNKMSEDMRILFTEYRQKRKGEFNSEVRRANDLNQNHE